MSMPERIDNAAPSPKTGNLSAAGPTSVKEVFGYDVISRLGVGARSVVYLVADRNTRKKYALKRVQRANPELDDPAIEQMKVEAEIGRRLDHPNLRRIHEIFYEKKLLFFGVKEVGLLMELVDGASLLEKNDYDLTTLVEIFVRTATGLEAMHAAGWTHADMKPHNIMVAPGSVERGVKIVDFGQSCPVGTVKHRIQGTPEYIAPEQVLKQAIDQRTDVFNLGATMYWAFTGKNIPSMFKELQKAGGGGGSMIAGAPPYPKVSELNPAVGPLLDALVMQCCRRDRNKRPESMTEVRTRLEEVLAGLHEAELTQVPAGAGGAAGLLPPGLSADGFDPLAEASRLPAGGAGPATPVVGSGPVVKAEAFRLDDLLGNVRPTGAGKPAGGDAPSRSGRGARTGPAGKSGGNPKVRPADVDVGLDDSAIIEP